MPHRALAAILLIVASPAFAQRHRAVYAPGEPLVPGNYREGGYADKTSVLQGGSITLHFASTVSPLDVVIANRADDKVLTTITGLRTQPRDCTGGWATGCGWPATITIAIPATTRSGYYAATFPTSSGNRRILFVVRAAKPSAPLLIVSGTNTFQAYNTFGGRNVYPSDAPRRSFRVSFDRPYSEAAGLARFRDWEQQLVIWLLLNGIPYDVATEHDLDRDPTLLSGYKVVVLAGHLEYWTLAERRNLERYSANGGHVAVLAGNTMWWQVRYEDDGRTMVVYKDPARDPENGRRNEVVTTNWFASPVYQPENLILGLSFRNGGFANGAGSDDDDEDDDDATPLPASQRTPFTLQDASTWVTRGLGFNAGEKFGPGAAGTEVDGAVYNCTQNGLVVDGSDGTPANFHIVATVPASDGHGILGYYVNAAGGVVFNAGSRDWTAALLNDASVAAITRTVLTQLMSGQPFVYDPVTTTVRARDLFNCVQESPKRTTLHAWRGETRIASLSQRCAWEGPAGIELGAREGEMARNFTPANVPLERVEMRFYIDATDYSRTPGSQFTLLTLQNRTAPPAATPLLQLKIGQASSGHTLQLVQLRPEGGAEAATAAVPLPDGFRSVQISWRSPGDITLQVDDATPVKIVNTRSGQSVNEYLIAFSGASASRGTLCLDAITVAETPVDPVPPTRF